MRTLGTGSFGQVMECEIKTNTINNQGNNINDNTNNTNHYNNNNNCNNNNNNNNKYALKKSRRPVWNPTIRERCLQDYRQAKRLCPHPHLTTILDAWAEAAHVYTLMELCASSLKDRLAHLGAPVEERLLWQYVTGKDLILS